MKSKLKFKPLTKQQSEWEILDDFQEGGRVPIKGTKGQYQAYQDSLDLYDKMLINLDLVSEQEPAGLSAFNLAPKRFQDYYTNDKIKPSGFYKTIHGVGTTWIPQYKKPVQPIIYQQEASNQSLISDWNPQGRQTFSDDNGRVYYMDGNNPVYKPAEKQRPKEQPINIQSSKPYLLQGNNKQLEFNSVPYKQGTYFTRDSQSQETGKKEYFDKTTGKKLMQSGGSINNTGYLKNSRTKNNKFNIIPSSTITTQGMIDRPIHAVDNLGFEKILYPNTGEHQFPGDYVVEKKLPKAQDGKKIVYTDRERQPEFYSSDKQKPIFKTYGNNPSTEKEPYTLPEVEISAKRTSNRLLNKDIGSSGDLMKSLFMVDLPRQGITRGLDKLINRGDRSVPYEKYDIDNQNVANLLGIQNPVGKFVMNAAIDPVNYLPLPYVSDFAKNFKTGSPFEINMNNLGYEPKYTNPTKPRMTQISSETRDMPKRDWKFNDDQTPIGMKEKYESSLKEVVERNAKRFGQNEDMKKYGIMTEEELEQYLKTLKDDKNKKMDGGKIYTQWELFSD